MKASKTSDGKEEAKMNEGMKARIELRPLGIVQSAEDSAGDARWIGDEFGVREDEHGDEQEEELDAVEARLDRGVAARLNDIAPDSPEESFAVKEAARNMSCPRPSVLRRLRKIGHYLLGHPRHMSLFKCQDQPTRVTTFTDSDWPGCTRTAKSTSGGAVCIGGHVVKTYCKQQKAAALSSAEAELYAMVAASAETLAVAEYATDLGEDLECELYCDSAAALGMLQRWHWQSAPLEDSRNVGSRGQGVGEYRLQEGTWCQEAGRPHDKAHVIRVILQVPRNSQYEIDRR